MKRFTAISLVSVLMFMGLALPGCGSNPTPIPPPTPTVLQQITTYATDVGIAAKAFLPMAGTTGEAITATIQAICLLKSATGDPAALQTEIQALLQKLWTQIDASQSGALAAVAVIAINTLWGFVQTQIANQDAQTALAYLNAVVTGICDGFGVPASTWGKIKAALQPLEFWNWGRTPKAYCPLCN